MKRNRKALEQQMKQKRTAEPKAPVMDFEHDLLLGHVSMLTDVIMAEISHSDGNRRYVFTADRDEHIRLSRGPPQCYVIEAFLLGHDELVNKLLIPSWDTKILISGGGDDYLLVWNWLENKILQKIEIKQYFQAVVSAARHLDGVTVSADNDKIMVAGLWSTFVAGFQGVVVSCEA